MNDNPGNPNSPAGDDMSEYLQMFLDETEEQLDDLVETMLALENDPTDNAELNDAFRLIHSIKGSAGMMGFDNITVLTHHLENRFERFRSGTEQLDQRTMNLVLRCIDFLRECTERLRRGSELGNAADLLAELHQLEDEAKATEQLSHQGSATSSPAPAQPAPESESAETVSASETAAENDPQSVEPTTEGTRYTLTVTFEAGLPLADLKAQLIVSRLAAAVEIQQTTPPLDTLHETEFSQFILVVDTDTPPADLRAMADVDGVQQISCTGDDGQTHEWSMASAAAEEQASTDDEDEDDWYDPEEDDDSEGDDSEGDSGAEEEWYDPEEDDDEPIAAAPEPAMPEATFEESVELAVGEKAHAETSTHSTLDSAAEAVVESPADTASPAEQQPPQQEPAIAAADTDLAPGEPAAPVRSLDKPKVAETMRVDIDRLDGLMNLTGELVVNRARFMQIAGQVVPPMRQSHLASRTRQFAESLERMIDDLRCGASEKNGQWQQSLEELKSGLDLIREQSAVWDSNRQCFGEIAEAIDQLGRVSDSLQRGVLETRMVPVGPLFSRFKRVVRDLSVGSSKRVSLQLLGEKTELDKRMIDELADPLVHLIRNSIDHGMEPPEVRLERGKSEVGTVTLEASHRGNNVYILVSDDGGGINVDKIRHRLIEKGIVSENAVREMDDTQVLDYIWHPGFSTADAITDVSGRGVGMDVVKTRINDLNGSVQVETAPEQGTTFTIRLPLTLAIINSLLVQIRSTTFSIPIDDVREIVSIARQDVITIHGKHTFDVRGEFIPLVSLDDIFDWHRVAYDYQHHHAECDKEQLDIVILVANGRPMGLRVDELLGSQDIVIKSLSENFVSIRGLSGASILGDGTVCLMLDVGPLIDSAVSNSRLCELTKETAR